MSYRFHALSPVNDDVWVCNLRTTKGSEVLSVGGALSREVVLTAKNPMDVLCLFFNSLLDSAQAYEKERG